jgi:hypothetical protein
MTISPYRDPGEDPCLTNKTLAESLMSLWLVRKDLFGDFVGAALCITSSANADRSPADLILNAFAALQLADGERLQPGNHRLWIDHQGNLIGYFDILESAANPAAAS